MSERVPGSQQFVISVSIESITPARMTQIADEILWRIRLLFKLLLIGVQSKKLSNSIFILGTAC